MRFELYTKENCVFHKRTVEIDLETGLRYSVFHDKTSNSTTVTPIKKRFIGIIDDFFDENGQDDLVWKLNFAKDSEAYHNYDHLYPEMFTTEFFLLHIQESKKELVDKNNVGINFNDLLLFYSLPNNIWVLYDYDLDIHYLFN